ncbi:MAG: AAA family ATPase, partial [Anaerolineae bacterium]
MTSATSKPLVVIVTGPPGAGKTTLGRRLSEELRLPFIGKDDVRACQDAGIRSLGLVIDALPAVAKLHLFLELHHGQEEVCV